MPLNVPTTGGSGTASADGSVPPTTPPTTSWQVNGSPYQTGPVIATNAASNGWQASSDVANVTVTVPSGYAVGNSYAVRCTQAGGGQVDLIVGIVAASAPTVPPGPGTSSCVP